MTVKTPILPYGLFCPVAPLSYSDLERYEHVQVDRLQLLEDRTIYRKKHYRLIWSALSFITCLENRGQKVQCFLSCLHVGGKRGSVLTCQKFLVKYNRQQLHRMLLDCRTDEVTDIRSQVCNGQQLSEMT
uniref:POP5 homolog, ribonuclease P/MRP subunit n=1 Tax=Sinocyclocheilus rhinocerous TaxID=307959 RepID=A0A673GAV3_9TELE